MRSQPSVFMIGWEYPPHNSGGLGVACEGLTKALSASNTEIFFTLPYSSSIPIAHMRLLSCFSPNWLPDVDVTQLADGYTPSQSPFSAYNPFVTSGTQPTSYLNFSNASSLHIDSDDLHAIPQSQLESQVEAYAEVVSQQGQQVAKDVDVIHAHDWMSFPAALKLQQATGKPVVAHIHSTEFDRIPHGSGSQYIMETEYRGIQAATRVIAVSYYTKRLLVEKYGVDPRKIDVVYNGIDPISQASQLSSNFALHQPVIVFMGRLTMQKGVSHFLQVAQSVVRQIPDALFIVAGSGDMYHELLFKAAYDRLSAHVLFSGFLRDRQKEMLLQRADVFVMPSLSEPFGLVALEAAQRHTPVIISKQSGVAEVMPNAIQLDFWDTEAMSRAITELITNQEHHARVVTEQLQDVSQVSWHRAAKGVLEVYQRAFLGK